MTTRKEASKGATRRRLGRGLSSLISAPVNVAIPEPVKDSPRQERSKTRSTNATPSQASRSQRAGDAVADHKSDSARPPALALGVDSNSGVAGVPIGDVHPNPNQPRQRFEEGAIESLATSIRSAGLMQPIVVRPRPAGGFELIAGERRWRAAQRVGLTHIPAVVRDVDDQQATEWSLVENLQREDLNPIERGEAFQRLIADYQLTHQEIADAVGFDRSSISNHLRLLDLDEDLKQLVREGLLSQGHARASLAIANLDHRKRLVLKAIREGWSVRELERRARAANGDVAQAPEAKTPAPRQAHLQDLERKLGEHLGSRVTIQSGRKKGSGSIKIAFFDFDQFEGLMERLGYRCE